MSKVVKSSVPYRISDLRKEGDSLSSEQPPRKQTHPARSAKFRRLLKNMRVGMGVKAAKAKLYFSRYISV